MRGMEDVEYRRSVHAPMYTRAAQRWMTDVLLCLSPSTERQGLPDPWAGLTSLCSPQCWGTGVSKHPGLVLPSTAV